MTNEELVNVFQTADTEEARRDALEALYLQTRRLIGKAANRFHRETEDLEQEGFLILYRAAETYQPDEGVVFASYLFTLLRRGFWAYLVRTDPEGVSATVRKMAGKYLRFVDEYRQTVGRIPTDREIIFFLKLPPETLQTVRAALAMQNKASLDTPITDTSGGDTGTELSDFVADPADRIGDALEEIDSKEAAAELWAEVDRLPGSRGEILKAVYQEGQTVTDIAAARGISPQRVSYLVSDGRMRLGKSEKVQALAGNIGLAPGKFFRGGFRSFREHGTSITEYMAIDALEGWDEKAVSG